jgi:hypothetical protein
MIRPRSNNILSLALLLVALAVLCAGCRCHEKKRAIWIPPLPIAPQNQNGNRPQIVSESLSDLSFAESS